MQQSNMNIGLIKMQNTKLKNEIEQKDELIQKLQNELNEIKISLEANPRNTYNERGAGRKSKITKELVEWVLCQRQNGYSFAQIANFYMQETGEKISKSTIDRVSKMKNFD